MKKKPQRYEHSLLHTVEQATELLRRVDTRAWVWWFGGTAPFVSALLHFWTDMSRAADAWDRLPGAALLLALAYGWMKVAHCLFCDHLMRHLRGEERPAPLPLRGKLRLISSQALIHFSTPWVLVLSLVAVLPFGWAYAFYHNVTVLAVQHFRTGGRTAGLIRLALRQSHYRQLMNHGILIVLFIFALMLWMNGWSGLIQVSMLLRSFSGEENALTRNVWTLLSSTVFVITAMGAYLLGGPLVKAVYTLRCFYGLSRKNGEDLLVAFRSARAQAAVPLVLLAAAILSLAAPSPASAQTAGLASAEQVSPGKSKAAALDDSLREVLKEDDFQWRMPRQDKPVEERGVVGQFMHGVSKWIEDTIKGSLKAMEKWLKDILKGWMDTPMREGGGATGTPWADLSYLILKLLVVVLALVLVILLVRYWMKAPPTPMKAAAAMPEINLENENVVASLLPENEWLKLAQEKMDTGDYRLAMRALFLATLAHLGERRLLGIGKSKSNGDYVRELSMRARDRDSLRQSFGETVRVFDWAWYGLHDVTRDLLDQFRANHQRITSDGSPG